MKKVVWLGVFALILALTACAVADGGLETPAGEDSPQEEGMLLPPVEPVPPEEIPAENRVAAITPAYGERIREMKEENEAVVGWLRVPGTDIDSVIVQNPADENGFYTYHDLAGNPSKDGTYCADNRCDFTVPTREGISQNIALYGHSWDENPDGRLFAQLKRFKDPDFAQAHPYLFFSTEGEDMAWEVFAVYNITVNQPYIIPDLPWASLAEMLDIVYEASVYDYGIRLTQEDKILTLSTCSFDVPGRDPLPLDQIPDYRFVIMARLVLPDDTYKEAVSVTPNGSPLPPDAMPAIYSHHSDLIQYRDTLYDNLARFHADKIPDIDPSGLIPVGEVARSGVMRDLQDLDATKLPQGTALYLLEGHENLLVAVSGEETMVYGYGMK